MNYQLDYLENDYLKIESDLTSPDIYGNPQRLKELMMKKKSLQ